MSSKTTHLIKILSDLIQGKKLASIDIIASNSNQYFCNIKNKDIELIEERKPNLTNGGYHLERSLMQSVENLEKANKYLNKLRGVSSL